MKFTFNTPEMKGRRQTLRTEMPRSERILWQILKGRQVGGIKFRRQFGVGPYVLDFYCPEARLCIEVDGDSHSGTEAEEYDRQRDQYIRSHDIVVLRFSNDEVQRAPDMVIEKILRYVPKLEHVPPHTHMRERVPPHTPPT